MPEPFYSPAAELLFVAQPRSIYTYIYADNYKYIYTYRYLFVSVYIYIYSYIEGTLGTVATTDTRPFPAHRASSPVDSLEVLRSRSPSTACGSNPSPNSVAWIYTADCAPKDYGLDLMGLFFDFLLLSLPFHMYYGCYQLLPLLLPLQMTITVVIVIILGGRRRRQWWRWC